MDVLESSVQTSLADGGDSLPSSLTAWRRTARWSDDLRRELTYFLYNLAGSLANCARCLPLSLCLQAPKHSHTADCNVYVQQLPASTAAMSVTTSAKEVMFSLCLFVCLMARLRNNNSTDFHKIRRKGSTKATKRKH